jgi:hypothetical protein
VPAWESYHVRELVPFVDRRFPTRADAGGRAIAGISMGGGGAVKYAAEFPGTFGYAGSFSGSLDPTVGMGRSKNCVRGEPTTQEVVWRDNSPTALAANLRGVRLFVRSGDGTPGPYDSPTPPTDPAERTKWQIRLLTEAGAHQMAQNFLAALKQAGISGADARFFPGSHSQPYWERDLKEFAGWLRGRLAHPPTPPPAFTADSAHQSFTAWGWSFATTRAVREFAYVDVAADRLAVTGSGKLDVVTPPRYVPGRRYRVQVDGATRTVVADRGGRLSFRLDLGPSHTTQQTDFGPDATRGWRTVTVALSGRPAQPTPPKPEAVATRVVPLPAAVTGVRFAAYTADGSRLLASATSTGFAGTQVVSFTEGGTGLRCLTCATWNGAELLKPAAFPDGRRVLVRVGPQTPTTPADHAVVECAPSVLDCRSARVVPIVPPAASDPNVEQDQRELRLSPDGVHVALTQIRRTPSGRATGVGIVGVLSRGPSAYQVADARVVATGGEVKGFTPDGQSVTFARFLDAFEAGNPDDVTVDLRSGRERRLTTALDWDEDVDLAAQAFRGRRWMVVGSGRGTGLLETVSQIRRPPVVETGIQALPFAVFGTRNPQIAEPWLVDANDARPGYLGQPLAAGAIAAGWDSKPNFRWKPDGTAVVFWQQRIGGTATRVVVARLTERRPGRPQPVRATPAPRWAAPVGGYVPPDVSVPSLHRGRVSGTIEVAQRPSPVPGFDFLIEVTYRNYADEAGFVVDGVERSYYDRPGLYGADSRYSADLRVTGRHTGYLRARDVSISPGAIAGTIESSLDGRRLSLGPLP